VGGVSNPLGSVARSATVHEGGAGSVLHITVPVSLVARGVRAVARDIRAVARGIRAVARGVGTVARGVGTVGRGGISTVGRGIRA